MKITIVGAGNVGTQFAVHCAEKGHDVIVYSPKAEMINQKLEIIDGSDRVIHSGLIKKAVVSEKEAFECAELIFITVPATLMKENAEKIEPFVKEGMKICLVSGTGGGECAFAKCLDKGAIIFGLQRVPSVARLVEYGKRVRAIGYRDEMFVAALPNSKTEECRSIIENIFDIKCSSLPNYLNITLTPSNPILHTTRLKNIYGDYKVGKVYDRVPLFYEEWNDETSKVLFKCDAEVQKICLMLNRFDLSYVKSLKLHYESPTIEAFTEKIRSIDGFKGLVSPAIKVDNGYIPDFDSRYFTADFSYGLVILVQIAELIGLEVPNMKELIMWYYSLVGKRKEFSFKNYNIFTKEDLFDFYAK